MDVDMAARASRTAQAKGAAQARRAAAAKRAAQAGQGPVAEQAQPAKPQPAKPSKAARRRAAAAMTAGETAGETAAASQAAPVSEPAPAREPRALWLAAAAQGIEAVGVAVAGVFAAASTVDGRSYTASNGIALTLFLFLMAAAGVALAVGLARARPWSRVPAAMTQLIVIVAAIALLDGHRPEWGVPALALAAACLAGLFTPASLRALNRQLDQPPAKSR
jgi:hypothetical protein